ncbi:hypothetical protein I3F58_08415 [Streptomyces sp. MUM 203J]|uniref:hypothetical protein n=1 Tax=Streptomyces sp. MUM 203J TaxID=2791990 RepID=UPI001F036196|nr:hypothetical protein [Streptomyces sp. MUM 203J]MCH0539590.1 hypothetical protein [Streptomyces sp. MUM 203J]
MTTTPLTPRPAPAPAPTPADRALRALAIAACVPYMGLKAAWIAGSRVGIPEGSVLLERPGVMAVANSVTLLMDAALVVLALLLTQRWGLRVRAALLVFPMWVATGLLLPIVVGYPVDTVVGLATGGEGPVTTGPPETFLDPWVFTVVYGGFILQALALGTLFVRYAGKRWSRVWRGTVGDLSPAVSGTVLRVTAAVASLAVLLLAGLQLAWALGLAGGPGSTTDGTGGTLNVQEALRPLYAMTAVAGVLSLAFRRGRSLPVALPLGFAWAGAGAVACWGGWILLAAMTPAAGSGMEPPALLLLAYAGEMITGTVLAGCVAVFLRRRAA